MKIGNRIVLTSTALIAVTLGAYSLITLRARRSDLEAQLRVQAEELATTLRVAVEAQKPFNWPAGGRELVSSIAAALPWQLTVLDAGEAGQTPRLERLRRLLALRTAVTDEDSADGRHIFYYLEPVSVASPLAPDGRRILGAIEVSRDMAFLDELMLTETALQPQPPWPLLILAMILAISLSARRSISRPIGKLIAGIDDVAKGDLSHVVLQEQEDEIGALSARFNDMTQSLRDARAETRRGADERLALEAHLRDTAQLATIGQLAAEIAHEVGTPLNVVTGRARAMARKSDDPAAVQKNATIIAEQAGRITRIIQRLLDVARRKVGGSEKSTVDVNRVAADTLELLEVQLAGARVEARLRLE